MKSHEAHHIAQLALRGDIKDRALIQEAYGQLVNVASTSFGTEAFLLADRFPDICDRSDLDWLNEIDDEEGSNASFYDPIYSDA